MTDARLRAKLEYNTTDGLATSVKVTTQAATIKAATLPLVIEQGRRFSLPVDWQTGAPATVNLSSGYTATFQVRSGPGAASAYVSLTESAGITLAATAPNITVAIAGTATAALDFEQAYYELAVTQTSGTVVTYLLSGPVKLVKRVTG